MDDALQNVDATGEAPGTLALEGSSPADSLRLFDGGNLQRGISRRTFLKLTGGSATTLALASVSLVSCTPQSSTTTVRTGGKVQLVYQDCRCLGEQLLFDQFHALHPNIEVFYSPDPDNFEEKMLTDMEAGTAPDVLAGCCDTMPIWAQKGFLLDLRPYVKADLESDTIADWDPAQYKSFFTQDGVQYALPKYHGALALYYNKDMFDEAYLSYPDNSWDHNDYLAAMRKLTVDSDGDGKIDRWGSMVDVAWERIQIHVNGWGGHLVDPGDPNKSWMARPEAFRQWNGFVRACGMIR